MSCSETSTRSSPNRLITASKITTPAMIVGARSGCRPRRGGAARASASTRRAENLLAAPTIEHVAVDPLGVVGVEVLGDRGQRCGGAGDRDRVLHGAAPTARARQRRRISRTSSRRARRISAAVGGSWWRWRSVWRTTPACVETWNSTSRAGPDHHLGRAAADVEHQRRRRVGRVALAGRAEERERAPPRRRSGRAARARSGS